MRKRRDLQIFPLEENILYQKQAASGSVSKLKACKDEVDFLREKYTELPDNDGVELYDKSKIKLTGPDLRILVAKAEYRFPMLQRYNEQLMIRNLLTTSHIFRDEKVYGMGLLEPGTIVWKTGRTTGQTKSNVNDVGIIIWKDGFMMEEVAVISSFSSSRSSLFTDNSDSGTLIFCIANSLKAVELVVGRSELQVLH
ncbi:unnamed protein product [Tuber aestivum]|uniref:Uncharacterized protein n=1 Tax=Tuber aestivum TaxID=59557 RepID=A0A292Q7N8_9PEZI|nr:unnamed protein product [Tuber aestivum]